MGQITIQFAGICAHFRRPALEELTPVVRHRVVLPAVATFRMDVVDAPGFDFQAYFLQPHYAVFEIDGLPAHAIPRILADGYLVRPCRITVPNAERKQPLGTFPSSVPRLTEFIAGYEPSAEVVFGKRAACHFDVEHGAEFAASTAAGGAIVVTITIHTKGSPVLRFTPMDEDVPVGELKFDCDDTSVDVFNAEPQPPLDEPRLEEDTPYDFLLHYETSTRGVPQRLTTPTPGMTAPSVAAAPFSRVGRALVMLADTIDMLTARPRREAMEGLTPDSLNPSCSNSQYP